MSLDQIIMLPPGYGFDSAAEVSPVFGLFTYYWALDEASGVASSSAGSADLTATNSPVAGTGKVGNGRAFVAASSQQLSRNMILGINYNTDWTLCLWVNPVGVSGFQGIFKKNTPTSSLRFFLSGSAYSQDWSGGPGYTSGASFFAAGTWCQVTVTYQGTGDKKIRTYKNGTLVNTSTANAGTQSDNDAGQELFIGSLGGSGYLGGIMDEVGFAASTCFDADQVTAYYDATSAGRGFDSAGGDSPTVFTLVLDDLLTRHYPSRGQQFKLTATAGTTAWIEFDDNVSLYSVSAFASQIETELEAIAGYSGKVSVSGASSEAGDKYTFTITFDASLGAVTLAFHASSVWRSPITLTESVTQQGVNPVFEQVSLEASLDEFGDGTVTDNIGNSQTVAANTVSNIAASGWTCTNPGTTPGLFVCNTAGPQGATTTPSSGSGSILIIETGVGGQVEIHTVTPSPTEPTGGTFAIAGEASLAYDSEIGMSLNTVSAAWNKTSGTSLADGPVAFTTDVDVDAGDSELNVDGTNLTAPEITHSIT